MSARAAVLCAVAALVALPATAEAKPNFKKAIFGPITRGGTLSAFGLYNDMNVGIYERGIYWNEIAAAKPKNAADPNDRNYVWPDDLDYAIGEAHDYGMQVAVTISRTPGWANGGLGPGYAPKKSADFAAFMTAAAKRYPQVAYWRLWDEPNYANNWAPEEPETRFKTLSKSQQAAPRRYARLVDAAYGALRKVKSKALLVAGNTATGGDVSPLNWIKWMILPNGKPPRYDMYGHDPIYTRYPSFGVLPPLGAGFADFNDLPLLIGWLDRYQHLPGRTLPVWLGRFDVPGGGHVNQRFGDLVLTNDQQADWIRHAYQQVIQSKRVFTLGYDTLYDEPALPDNTQREVGLLDINGNPKPAFYAFRDS